MGKISFVAWFHGKGVYGGTRPIIYLMRGGSWNNDGIGIFAGYSSSNDKLVLRLRDADKWDGSFASDLSIEYDRWTHLAVTVDASSGK